MKRKRHTPEQIVRKLREGDRLLNEGQELGEVLRQLEVSESSWNRWRAQYGGMKADEAKRLKELERENARLKRLLAEAELDKAMLKELMRLKEAGVGDQILLNYVRQRKLASPLSVDDILHWKVSGLPESVIQAAQEAK